MCKLCVLQQETWPKFESVTPCIQGCNMAAYISQSLYFCAYPYHDFSSDRNLFPPSLHFGRGWLPIQKLWTMLESHEAFCAFGVSSILSNYIVSSILSNLCPVFCPISVQYFVQLVSSICLTSQTFPSCPAQFQTGEVTIGQGVKIYRYIFVYTQITNNDHHTGPWRYVS